MQDFDIGLSDMMAKAQKLGDERAELEKENKRRVKKGLAPLPDPQDLKDQDVSIRRTFSTAKTITAEEALMRMNMGDPDPDPEEKPVAPPPPKKSRKQKAKAKPVDNPEPQQDPAGEVDSDDAIRHAEAARRVDDMKHGRINHLGNWTMGVDMGLEGGSETKIVDHGQIRNIVAGTVSVEDPLVDAARAQRESTAVDQDAHTDTLEVPFGNGVPNSAQGALVALFQDLYNKLGISFDALETTLSDLQGRVSEIVSMGAEEYAKPSEPVDDGYSAFKAAMSNRTKVTYNINGTKISCDAVKVYLEPPCLTIVTREDSAAVKPKPASKLRISYEFEGLRYDDDLVTFLGTSFVVPELGLRFSGFVRDSDADLLDVDAEG